MGKSATGPTLAKIYATENVEPVYFIEITWPVSGVERYGDRSVSQVAGLPVLPRLKSMGEIRSQVGSENEGTVGNCSIELLDWDRMLFLRMQQESIEEATVRILLHFDGTAAADVLEVLGGKVGAPVEWSEKTRTLAFDVVSAVVADKATFTPTVEELPGLEEDADGRPWPICFGVPRDVPAVLVRRGPRTQLRVDADSSELVLQVEDGESVFGSASMTIDCDGEWINGHFDGDTFVANAGGRNATKYSRNTKNRPSSDPDFGNPFVLWINNSATDDFTGNFLRIGGSDVPGNTSTKRVNFCVAQKGDKLWFERPWTNNLGGEWLVGGGVPTLTKRFYSIWLDNIPGANGWSLQAGALITQVGNNLDIYVANDIPSTEVYRVRARRRWRRNVAGLEEDRIVTVPSQYYTVQKSNTSLVAGRSVTTLTFVVPLSSRNAGWDDREIYVTLASAVGRNTADQIAYLIQYKTNLTPHASLTVVMRNAVENYPSDCAILDTRNAMAIAHDMAWQARCALIVVGNTVKGQYLSKDPAGAVDTGGPFLTDAYAIRESVVLRHSETDNVRTVLVGHWRKAYTDEEDRKIQRSNNEAKFGARRLEREFWIYQRKNLVIKSVEYWVGILSRIWTLVQAELHYQGATAEPWDKGRFQMEDILPSPSGSVWTGWTREVIHSSNPVAIGVLMWLPVESGSQVQSAAAYVSDAGDTKPNAPSPSSTNQEIAKVTPLSFANVTEPLQQAVPSRVEAKISGSAGTYVVRLFPQGFGNPDSGTVHMTVLNPPSTDLKVGDQSLVWRLPNGSYVSDVYAS